MSRCLLHKTKLEEFKKYLDRIGVPHRPGKGEWKVLQVCKDGYHWNSIFTRLYMPEHFTNDVHLDGLVRDFCLQRKS